MTTPNIQKSATGIVGFDQLTRGGLPRSRLTLVVGGPGTGKTVFGLEALFRRARELGEPGVLVTFEETAAQVFQNAASFSWFDEELPGRGVFHIDGHLPEAMLATGDFDLNGLLAALSALVRETGAQHVVFDGVDVLLAQLEDPRAVRREIMRLRQWVLDEGSSAILSGKLRAGDAEAHESFDPVQYAADCVIALRHAVRDRTAHRTLRVFKYRGSAHSADEVPFAITRNGVVVAQRGAPELCHRVIDERVSSGVQRLDRMLGGGFWRGSSVLISGAPGTAKSTLAAAFSCATCDAGERALYVSFDESSEQITRNARSVGIALAPHLEGGSLRIASLRSRTSSAELHVDAIASWMREHQPRAVVVDPISAFAHVAGPSAAEDAAVELVDLCKDRGVTLLCTSLIGARSVIDGDTPTGLSTIADTWIHVSYVSAAGERNRALSIVKSRGTKHSNQVRELVLDDGVVDLADVYTAGGEVLLGTLRWEKERLAEAERAERELERGRRRVELERELSSVEHRARDLEAERDRMRRDLDALSREEEISGARTVAERNALMTLRDADHEEAE